MLCPSWLLGRRGCGSGTVCSASDAVAWREDLVLRAAFSRGCVALLEPLQHVVACSAGHEFVVSGLAGFLFTVGVL